MRNPIEIENIEEMRRLQSIDDVQLREKMEGLVIGDRVKLTLLPGTGSLARETVLVRITSICGAGFRGKLVSRPASTGLSNLRVGWPLAFTVAHIHSVPEEQSAHGR
jgi:hypothetical protein